MYIYIQDNLDTEFIYKFIPKMYNIYLHNNLIKSNKINNYLLHNYNISIEYLIQEVANNLLITKINNSYVIEINKNIVDIKTNLNLLILVKLVDFGNSDIKGINLFFKTLKQLKENFRYLYQIYKINKERERRD